MFTKKALVFAAGVATAAAVCTTPSTGLGGSNAVTKPDGSNTPTIGKPFEITYDGTGLSDTVSFLLYRGPGEALVLIGSIGAGVTNCKTTGCTYTWTPDCSLTPDTSRYGIQLLDDVTCKFQYTTQFGLNAATSGCSKPPVSKPPTSSTPPKPSGSPHPQPSGEPPKPSDKPDHPSKPVNSGYPHPPEPTETECDDETYTSWTSVYHAKPTGGYVATNATGVSYTNPSTTYTPQYSNDGGRVMAGAAGVMAVLGLALLL